MKLVGGPLLLAAASAVAQSDDPPPIYYPPLPATASSAEGFISPGWVVASKAKGDLNRDGRTDLALALWTERAAKANSFEEQRDAAPYRLVIAFGQADGNYRLVTDNRTLIEPPGFSGAYEDPLDAESLSIARGSFVIYRELLRGHYSYRFRWSDNAFRLIGYEYLGSDGGSCITSTSINYLTKRAKLGAMPISDDREVTVMRAVKRGPLIPLHKIDVDFFADGMGVIGNWPNCPRAD